MSEFLREWRDGLSLGYREGFRWDPGVQTIVDHPAGERVTYAVKASCSNCFWEGEIRRPVGELCDADYPCPVCECRTVRSVHRR